MVTNTNSNVGTLVTNGNSMDDDAETKPIDDAETVTMAIQALNTNDNHDDVITPAEVTVIENNDNHDMMDNRNEMDNTVIKNNPDKKPNKIRYIFSGTKRSRKPGRSSTDMGRPGRLLEQPRRGDNGTQPGSGSGEGPDQTDTQTEDTDKSSAAGDLPLQHPKVITFPQQDIPRDTRVAPPGGVERSVRRARSFAGCQNHKTRRGPDMTSGRERNVLPGKTHRNTTERNNDAGQLDTGDRNSELYSTSQTGVVGAAAAAAEDRLALQRAVEARRSYRVSRSVRDADTFPELSIGPLHRTSSQGTTRGINDSHRPGRETRQQSPARAKPLTTRPSTGPGPASTITPDGTADQSQCAGSSECVTDTGITSSEISDTQEHNMSVQALPAATDYVQPKRLSPRPGYGTPRASNTTDITHNGLGNSQNGLGNSQNGLGNSQHGLGNSQNGLGNSQHGQNSSQKGLNNSRNKGFSRQCNDSGSSRAEDPGLEDPAGRPRAARNRSLSPHKHYTTRSTTSTLLREVELLVGASPGSIYSGYPESNCHPARGVDQQWARIAESHHVPTEPGDAPDSVSAQDDISSEDSRSRRNDKRNKVDSADPGVSNTTQKLIQRQLRKSTFHFPEVSFKEQRKALGTPRSPDSGPASHRLFRSNTELGQKSNRGQGEVTQRSQRGQMEVTRRSLKCDSLEGVEFAEVRRTSRARRDLGRYPTLEAGTDPDRHESDSTSSRAPDSRAESETAEEQTSNATDLSKVNGAQRHSKDKYSKLMALGLPRVKLDIDKNHFSRGSIRRRSQKLRERYDMGSEATPMESSNSENVNKDLMVISTPPDTRNSAPMDTDQAADPGRVDEEADADSQWPGIKLDRQSSEEAPSSLGLGQSLDSARLELEMSRSQRRLGGTPRGTPTREAAVSYSIYQLQPPQPTAGTAQGMDVTQDGLTPKYRYKHGTHT